jgi:hypothetical protein
MSAEWAVRDEQPILLTSTNPCITRAAGTQGVKASNYFYNDIVANKISVFLFKIRQYNKYM